MSDLFQKLKIPLIIVAVLICGYIIYNEFVKPPVSNALLQTQTSATSTPADQSILPLLLQIQGVTLDQKLFIDPVFRALIDRSQPIVPEPVGRQNPFSGALLGTVNSSVESLGFTDTLETPPATQRGTTR